MGAHAVRDGIRDGLRRRALCDVALGAANQPVSARAGTDGAQSGVRPWRRIATKGPWLLAPLLVAVLAVSVAPTNPVVGEPPAPTVHRSVQALDDAYRVAAAGGDWEALLEVGDAARRVGDAADSPETFDARAREMYRSALAWARRQGSLDGVLRVGEALAALGDREGFKESIRTAKVLAGRDPEAQADVRALGALATQSIDSPC